MFRTNALDPRHATPLAFVAALCLFASGCPTDDDDTATGDDDVADDDSASGDDDSADSVQPGTEFDRYCLGEDWTAAATPVVEGELSGVGGGYMSLEAGDLEAMEIVPEHPFYVTAIRVKFRSGAGPVILRLMTDFGRSYPDIDNPAADVIEPVDLDVTEEMTGEWLEIDVADRGGFLHPYQHYYVVYEHLGAQPLLSGEEVPAGERVRGVAYIDGSWAVIISGDTYLNFRLELRGEHFCAWDEADRWFSEVTAVPWTENDSSRATVVDVDGDRDDDLVLMHGGPMLYLNDGAGEFTEAPGDPFPGTPSMGFLVFGDLDNDGYPDAVGFYNNGNDGDGDGEIGGPAGDDCNDASDAVFPGATEVENGYDDNCDGVADEGFVDSEFDYDGDGLSIADGDCNDTDEWVFPGWVDTTNGIDDDCDGVADDGLDTKDADGDGYAIADGDCNDEHAGVNPGATEISNGYDDNCDGVADEGFFAHDRDEDGFTKADGDCDDTRDTVYPGAEELSDHRDNDCDLVVDEDLTNKVLLNDGGGVFVHHAAPDVDVLDPTGGAALGDGDGDGVLDLYYGNWLRHYPNPGSFLDRYLEGTGDGGFADRSDEVGMDHATQQGGNACYGVVWGDYNNDGWNDLYVGNYGYDKNFLWENQGDGTYLEVAQDKGASHDPVGGDSNQGGNTFGVDFGDIDNDGDLDIIATNIAHPRYQPASDITQLLQNQGPPDYTFVDIREDAGIYFAEGDVNATFFDFDNDGDQDLVFGSLYTGHYSALYRNDGGDTFTDVSYEAGVHVHDSVSAVVSDVDGDGDMDLIIADRTGEQRVQLFENLVGANEHWVELVLEGTTSNRSAIGARVTLEAGGITQIREIKGGGGHSGNQSSMTVHLGLGSATTIDHVEVRWPADAGTEVISGVAADGRYLVVEGSGATPL